MHIPFDVPVGSVSDLSATAAEEHASALKDSLITYAKSNFNRARITEVTFESAKNFCQQLGKIEYVKFHLEKCIIGSEIQEREHIRVSKHVLRATLDTLSKTTPSTGRGGQFFQLTSLLPGNAYELKELAATSCRRRPHA